VSSAERDLRRPDGATLLVGGSWRGAEITYSRAYPGDLTVGTGSFAAARSADAQDAYRCAADAQRRWAETPAPARAEVLQRAAQLLTGRVDAAGRRLTEDMGKAIRDARAEVRRSAAILRYFAGELLQPSGQTYPSSDPSVSLFTAERPLGVICAITPWNFPFAIPTWKLAPAIGFGNTVVWKPAEAASGSAVFLAQVLEEAGVPPGVLNVLTGFGSELSSPLLQDEALAALTFTGSGRVGSRLRAALAGRNVRVQLELGGKNPAIVLADADLQDAAAQVARGARSSRGRVPDRHGRDECCRRDSGCHLCCSRACGARLLRSSCRGARADDDVLTGWRDLRWPPPLGAARPPSRLRPRARAPAPESRGCRAASCRPRPRPVRRRPPRAGRPR
jgi:acyl-CoA reductase-like NAD-dependent aldehyde dehydrogenase